MVALRHHRLESWCAAITGVGTVILAVLQVAGGDDPAHLYRASLAARGVLVWDNFWYSGTSLPSYSLLFPPLATLVGLVPLAVLGGVLGSALFAMLLRTEYGLRAAVLPALAFAVLSCATLLTGEFPFALAVCTAILAMVLLQRARIWLALVCAGLTAGFSPLAFVLLLLLLIAVAVSRRALGKSGWLVVGGLAAIMGILVAVEVAFPEPGVLPFEGRWLGWALLLNGLGIILTAPVRRARLLCAFLVLWSVACLGAYAVPSPVGRDIVRPELYALPVLLLAGCLAADAVRRARRTLLFRVGLAVLAGVSLAAATVYDVPYALMVPSGLHRQRSLSSAWRPAESFLQQRSNAQYRVEVVPTPGHWEAYWLPAAGIPLVRGWFRQTDLVYNAPANAPQEQRTVYLRWLTANAVHYVVLPPGGVEAHGEAALLVSGRSGLLPVWKSHGWRAWVVPHPVGLLSGAHLAHLTQFGHGTIAGWVAEPGRYVLRVRYNPYWTVTGGSVCTARAAGGMTQVVIRRVGRFALASQEDPLDVIGNSVDDDLATCLPATFRR